MSSQSRQHHWDFARALYLLLGIPFHAAVVYSTHFVWSVSSPQHSPLLTLIADSIHVFRMPGFFILAGFFSMMMLSRQGARPWLGKRLVRLGLPLATATLTILPLQIVMQQYGLVVSGELAPARLGASIAFSETHFDEPWVSHLWFLYCLITYSAALAGIVALTGAARFSALVAAVAEFGLRHRWLAFATLAAACAGLALVLPALYRVGGSHMPAAVAYNSYAVYFCFGAAMFISAPLRAWYSGAGWMALGIGCLLGLVSLIAPSTPWSQAVFMISGVVAAMMITGFITGMATVRFNGHNPAIRRIVDASFTIYLFHHPLIFAMATLFLMLDWPPLLEWLITFTLAGLLSYGIHLLIARSAVALLLFNGARARPPAGQTGAAGLQQPSRAGASGQS
ncbi:glucan biosynthesis protein C [Hoeflea marina]|uniref:Glucan biosynthesis protein C n=1 Tax=Hoeflea marina TaxID=274592 RepID=A0A317PKG9_9HYPH|nr:acyltransferase family protein [Hoeflea marina]PWV99089.1 glucan biosynthesis protein C [Hoeflea marina]